jgi:hypothetical protein
VDPLDPESERIWADDDEVNILGTPLGSEQLISVYMHGKGRKHRLLFDTIKDVAAAGFPREADQMLKGAAVPHLSYILKSVQKNHMSVGWMKDMDEAHLSVWLHCLSASEVLEHALGPEGKEQLTDILDLPASYGGAGLHSLELSCDEELVGFFAGVTAALISFCKKTELPVYIRIAEALETVDDKAGSHGCKTVEGITKVNNRISTLREPLSAEEVTVATQIVRGQITIDFRAGIHRRCRTRPRKPIHFLVHVSWRTNSRPRANMNTT